MLFGKKKKLETIFRLEEDLKHIGDIRRLICESKFTNPEVTRQIFLRMCELDEQVIRTLLMNLKN